MKRFRFESIKRPWLVGSFILSHELHVDDSWAIYATKYLANYKQIAHHFIDKRKQYLGFFLNLYRLLQISIPKSNKKWFDVKIADCSPRRKKLAWKMFCSILQSKLTDSQSIDLKNGWLTMSMNAFSRLQPNRSNGRFSRKALSTVAALTLSERGIRIVFSKITWKR